VQFTTGAVIGLVLVTGALLVLHANRSLVVTQQQQRWHIQQNQRTQQIEAAYAAEAEAAATVCVMYVMLTAKLAQQQHGSAPAGSSPLATTML
jgi:hypothetical protein